MGKNSNKFKRVANSNKGKESRGGSLSKPRNTEGWKRKGPKSSDTRINRTDQKVTLKEDEVGITEFVNLGKGFTGVVKARYSDFHVNEIDSNGTVLQLNDLTIPQEPDSNTESSEDKISKNDVADIFTEDMWKEVEKLDKGERTEPLEVDVTELDKAKRTTIHKLIKGSYDGNCTSTTISLDGDKRAIRVLHLRSAKKNKRNKWTFPEEYVHFLVYKENMETTEMAVHLANSLRLKPSQVNYCGTKDKRGKTTQKFCVKRRQPSQIVRAVRRISSAKIGNFTFQPNVLKLGDLKGNRFRVALRLIDGDQEEIEKCLKSVKEYGFINYYGLQRFGNNASIPTHQIGIALLKSDYKTACELILKPRENDIPFMRHIRETWWKNRDSDAAAAMFYNDRFIEKKLLDGLVQYGENDYANALRKIPRNMLLMYTHAYQSLVFNRIASKRVKKYGLKLIVGDLVYRKQDELDEIAMDTDNVLSDVDQATEETKEEVTSTNENKSVFKEKVKPLTEEDISGGKYTIFDIVLPLPGHDITYPANEVAQWYEEILAEEELTSELLKHAVKTFSLAGAYRKLLIQPQNMTWYFKKYNTPEEDVITSHFESTSEKKKETGGSGKFTALVLDFCLPASVYATMFLREILKTDTSAMSQAQIGRNEMKKFEEKSCTVKDKVEEEEEGVKPLEDETEKIEATADLDKKSADKRSREDEEELGAKRLKEKNEVEGTADLDKKSADKRSREDEDELGVKRLKEKNKVEETADLDKESADKRSREDEEELGVKRLKEDTD